MASQKIDINLINIWIKFIMKMIKHIYEGCDIFLKSNWLESFSYPSLKIMETGGYSIFMSNSGNKDYINVGEKCLLYKLWDLNSETKCIEKSILNELLQQKLFIFGLITAKNRDWSNYKNQIISFIRKYSKRISS